MEDFDGEAAVDSLSALPVDVIYQIMERLTLPDAVRMSALSRSWKKNWLSLPCIVFDLPFVWFILDSRGEMSLYLIMHRILLLHQGPIVKFTIDVDFIDKDISQWLSYISKSVRELTVCGNFEASSSHVLWCCSKLRKLKLDGGTISIPPTFTGFSNLVTLELAGIMASGDDVFRRLIHTSSQLEKLVLRFCRGFGDIVIDFPRLRFLKILGECKSICYKSAPKLKVADLSELRVKDLDYEKALNLINFLASSCTIETLALERTFCKFFPRDDAGEKIFTSDHVKHLILAVNNRQIDKGIVYMISMMRTCPNMAHLYIELDLSGEQGEILESYHNCTLDHLREIYILRVQGLSAELKLIEFLLKSSPQLVKMEIVRFDDFVDWTTPEKLIMLPRASSEVEIIVVDGENEVAMEIFLTNGRSRYLDVLA